MNALRAEREASGVDLICFRTGLPITFPIKVACSKSHIINGSIIYKMMQEAAIITCPTWHQEDGIEESWNVILGPNQINIENFTFDTVAHNALIKVTGRIFECFQNILKKIPKNLFSSMINLENADLLRSIRKAFEEDPHFCQDQGILIEKLASPNNLTKEEAYVFSYTLSVQVKQTIFRLGRDKTKILDSLDNVGYDANISDNQLSLQQRLIQGASKKLQNHLLSKKYPSIKKIMEFIQ
ncbi:MAG: hypothetical protein QRY74_05080 [Chlamydia sp.]